MLYEVITEFDSPRLLHQHTKDGKPSFFLFIFIQLCYSKTIRHLKEVTIMTYFFLGLGILALLFPKAFNYLAWADQQTDTILKSYNFV